MDYINEEFEMINNASFKQKIYQYITLYTSINYNNIYKTHTDTTNDLNEDGEFGHASSLKDCVIFNFKKYYNTNECLDLFKINNNRINKKTSNKDITTIENNKDNTKKLHVITLNKEAKHIIDFIILGFLNELFNIGNPEYSTNDNITNLLKTKISEDKNSLKNFIMKSVNKTKCSLDKIDTYYLYNEFITHTNFYFNNIYMTDLFALYMTDFIKLLSINISNHMLFDKSQNINKKVIFTVLNNLSNIFDVNNGKIFYNMEKYIESMNPLKNNDVDNNGESLITNTKTNTQSKSKQEKEKAKQEKEKAKQKKEQEKAKQDSINDDDSDNSAVGYDSDDSAIDYDSDNK